MKASVSSILCGFSSASLALLVGGEVRAVRRMQLWIEIPPGTKPSALASYTPCTRPISSLITLRWNHGGRNVSSATCQRGGKITKSTLATPGLAGGRGEHGEERRIGVVEADRADRHEAREVVLVRHVVAVPGDHVERRMRELGRPQPAHELRDDLALALVLERGHRREEVARLREALRADRPELGQAERRAVVLAKVAARSGRRRRRGTSCRAARRRSRPGSTSKLPKLGDEHDACPAAARTSARRRRSRSSGPSCVRFAR